MMHSQPVTLFIANLQVGGAERIVVHLARAFRSMGVPTDVVLGKAEGILLDELPDDVRVFDLRAARISAGMGRFAAYLRERKPAGVISMLTHVNLVAIAARALARIQTRLCVCECGVLSASVRQADRRASRWLPHLARVAYPLATEMIAVTEATADDLASSCSLARDRIRVIVAPVDTEWIGQRAAEPVSHPWFDDHAAPVILGVGRMAKEKDFPTLVRAVALLRRKRPVRLVLIGDGDQRPVIEAEVKALGLSDIVWMPGFDPNPFRFMARAAVTVVSSVWEAGAYALLESMALGTPIVGTRCPGGVADFLGNGRFGPLAVPGDADSLAGCIMEALDHPVAPAILRAHAETFSPARIARRYLELAAPAYVRKEA